MNQEELEDLYIRSLDLPSNTEEERFSKELYNFPEFANHLAQHKKVRELLRQNEPATFGPYFAARLIHKIQNSGVVIDRQIFSFFKKFQLAALGVVVALLILNVAFAEQINVTSIFGLNDTIPPEDEIVSFDFFETLNSNL